MSVWRRSNINQNSPAVFIFVPALHWFGDMDFVLQCCKRPAGGAAPLSPAVEDSWVITGQFVLAELQFGSPSPRATWEPPAHSHLQRNTKTRTHETFLTADPQPARPSDQSRPPELHDSSYFKKKGRWFESHAGLWGH